LFRDKCLRSPERSFKGTRLMQDVEYLNQQEGHSTAACVVTMEKAVSEDFERVYPLLLDFKSPRIHREDWRTLFTNNWQSPEDYCGYLLLQEGEVKGYLGLLFSKRRINGRVEKFCNMTSWIVREDCRSQSLRPLLELLKLKDYTITNFTPVQMVPAILKKLGFAEFKTNQCLLFPVPGFAPAKSTYRCIFAIEKIRPELDDSDQAIFDDHQGFNCRHVLISAGDDYCYLVLKNKVHRHLPFARIHYLSNRNLFLEAIDSVRTKVCLKLKTAGLMVDERYLGANTFRFSREYQGGIAFFKSNSTTIDRNDIDTIYSELILLHD